MSQHIDPTTGTTTDVAAELGEHTHEEAMRAFWGEPIHVYTRADALRDGVLVAAPAEQVRQAGLPFPVALTAEAWADCVRWDAAAQRANPDALQDEAGRLHDVLFLAHYAALAARGSAPVPFTVHRVPADRACVHGEDVELFLHGGRGDAGEPVLTIMLAGQS